MCQENINNKICGDRNKTRDFDCFGELYKTKAGYLNINLEGNNKYLNNKLEVSKEISLGTDKTMSELEHQKSIQKPKYETDKPISSERCTI